MPLLSDHLIKQLIATVPKYLPHRLLHLFLPSTIFGPTLVILFLSCFILLLSKFSLRFLLSLSVMMSFNTWDLSLVSFFLFHIFSLFWVVGILDRELVGRIFGGTWNRIEGSGDQSALFWIVLLSTVVSSRSLLVLELLVLSILQESNSIALGKLANNKL